MREITERKRAEEDLLRLTVRLYNIQDEERRRIAHAARRDGAESLRHLA